MTAKRSVGPTPVSLLMRLQQRATAADWTRFVDIYGPVIYSWVGRRMQSQDAADLTQEILIAVLSSIGRWKHDPQRGRFRDWLWGITRNKLLDFWRSEERRARIGAELLSQEIVERLESSDGALEREWDQGYLSEVLARALQRLRPQFSPRTWGAFEQVVLQETPPAQAASALGMSLNAVYVAKSRVLARLREELDGLLD